MKKLKKIICITMLTICISNCLCFANDGFSFGTDFPYDIGDDEYGEVETRFGNTIKDNINADENGLKRLLQLFMPNDTMYGGTTNPSFLFYLKVIVNVLLGFVSLIALILTIYAFYMIFFKKDEAGITTAIQMIKGIVIALVVIGLSWIVVSFLFRFEKENTQNLSHNTTTEIVTSLT